MPQPKQSDEHQKDESTKEYVLDDKSTSDEVIVDKKSVTKTGGPVALTQDEYDRASALEGVKLVESSEKAGEEN